ncbi:ParB/RepB/Spo0J family partition protein [Caulobacter sp.]|uniref:ParB/RepB/Spo0J family partition protein n=1 Tax=Caulobacter sp. TaxID=78 RepID=UPI003BB2161A
MTALTPPKLTPLVTQNADVLRLIKAGGHTTKTAMARDLGRDQSAFGKTIALLTGEGWVAWPALTEAGETALATMDGAPPANDGANPVRPAVGLTHADIVPNPNQPRKKFTDEDIAELAVSIREQGLVQPLLVRPFAGEPDAALSVEGLAAQAHQLVAGERRWRAIGKLIEAGEWADDQPVPVVIRDMTDAEVAVISLVENLQRQDMTYLEEAVAFERLRVELDMPTQEIADKVGKTQRFVQQRLQLLELSAAEKAQLDEGTLSIRDARQRLANRPEPLNLNPAELMIVAELIAAATPDGGKPTYWNKVECSPQAVEWIPDGLKALITVDGPAYLDGRFYVRLANHTAFDRITAAHPELLADPAAAALAIRARAFGADKAEQAAADGRHITSWLNGPFALSAEGQAILDQREEEARQRAITEAEHAAAAQVHAARLAKANAATASPTDLSGLVFSRGHKAEAVKELLDVAGAALPWRFVEPEPGRGPGRLLDADGNQVDLEQAWGGADKSLRLKLVMAAVNAAAELEPEVEAAAIDPATTVAFECKTCGDTFDAAPDDPDCATCGTSAMRVDLADQHPRAEDVEYDAESEAEDVNA